MTKADLIALAERVERAEGPDRELDRAIKQAAGHDWDYSADWDYWDALKNEKASKPVAKPYTASPDAAMTLAPPPGKWSVTAGHADDWQAAIWFEDGRALDWRSAATPSLALTAAALRAIAEEMD